jgi:hypothetical protein
MLEIWFICLIGLPILRVPFVLVYIGGVTYSIVLLLIDKEFRKLVKAVLHLTKQRAAHDGLVGNIS